MDNKGLSLTSTPICVFQIVTQPLVSPVGGKKNKKLQSKQKQVKRLEKDIGMIILDV
jgi:hypothetical protein